MFIAYFYQSYFNLLFNSINNLILVFWVKNPLNIFSSIFNFCVYFPETTTLFSTPKFIHSYSISKFPKSKALFPALYKSNAKHVAVGPIANKLNLSHIIALSELLLRIFRDIYQKHPSPVLKSSSRFCIH